jgi:MFS-type transporter involved in bile tolerance (Atg22 family)
MDAPLGEQIVALIATLAALAVGGFTVAAVLTFGLATAAELLGIGLGAFGAARWALGRSIRTRTAPTSDSED